MPFEPIKAITTASYFTVAPQVKFTISVNGRDLPQESPGIVWYNKTTQQNEFVSTNFSGHLARLSIVNQTGVTKSNVKFSIDKLEMEFQSIKDSQVQKEIVQMIFDRPLARMLIGKLANCKSFGSINLDFGTYTDLNAKPAIKRDYVTVTEFKGGSKIKSMYITDEKYRELENQEILPTKIYLKDGKDGAMEPTFDYTEAAKNAQGFPEVSKKWQKDINAIFTQCVESINNNLESLKFNSNVTYSNVAITEDEYEQDFEPKEINTNPQVPDEDLPEIDLNKVQMPF
jgi:hypothetical protein